MSPWSRTRPPPHAGGARPRPRVSRYASDPIRRHPWRPSPSGHRRRPGRRRPPRRWRCSRASRRSRAERGRGYLNRGVSTGHRIVPASAHVGMELGMRPPARGGRTGGEEAVRGRRNRWGGASGACGPQQGWPQQDCKHVGSTIILKIVLQ